mgnify:CR=1 FL=1
MKEKIKHGKSYYTSTLWILIIRSVLGLVLFGASFVIYIIFKCLLTYVFKVEQAIGDMVSLIVSMFFFAVPFIPQIKYFYVKSFNIIQQKIYRKIRKRAMPCDLKTTAEQASIINKTLGLLKGEGSHLIALEGAPNKGKTMTAVFLIDNIGRDGNLLELFMQLQQHICYIDAGYEKAFLMNFLDDNAKASKSLAIIDNVHKLSSETLIAVLDKIAAISEYADSVGNKHLVILLYQSIENNDSTNRLLREYLIGKLPESKERFLKLDRNSYCYDGNLRKNPSFDQEGVILSKITRESCEALYSHLLSIYISSNKGTLINFLLNVLNRDADDDCLMRSEELQFITIIVVLSMYLGFVSKSSILHLWQKLTPEYRKMRCLRLIKWFSENRFILPFPLMENAFLFNEMLAYEYKKRLFFSEAFQECYYKCTHYLYQTNFFNASELEWLYLIACKPTEIQAVPHSTREKLFDSCIEVMSKSYVLAELEKEISLVPQKKSLFHMELGELYIKTGQWTDARQLLKPYIHQKDVPSNVYELQLQLIEADHGVDDSENLTMLNAICDMSDKPYIKFQAQYWTAHIKMEQGDFSLATWENLQLKVKLNPEWNKEHTYSHMVHRITADTCRTFFLKGGGNPCFFNQTLSFFKIFASKPPLQEDLALEELENAHYIHYELVYQLGIWQMYQFKHDKGRSCNDSASLEELVDTALTQYSQSISKFLKAGVKTWRTALIRREELSLCCASPNFIKILSQLDDFDDYARENHVDVFSGYVSCLRGKALAIYALCEALGNEDTSYERRLKDSLAAFQRSIRVYEQYGNTFGVLRSKMLFTLVSAIKRIGISSNDPAEVLNELIAQLEGMKEDFGREHIREQQVLKYLTTMRSPKIADIGNVIRYYPIVLQ